MMKSDLSIFDGMELHQLLAGAGRRLRYRDGGQAPMAPMDAQRGGGVLDGVQGACS